MELTIERIEGLERRYENSEVPSEVRGIVKSEMLTILAAAKCWLIGMNATPAEHGAMIDAEKQKKIDGLLHENERLKNDLGWQNDCSLQWQREASDAKKETRELRTLVAEAESLLTAGVVCSAPLSVWLHKARTKIATPVESKKEGETVEETWFGSSDGEVYHSGPYPSKEVATEKIPDDEGLEIGDNFYVGRGILAKATISGHTVLDEVADSLGGQVGEAAEGYLSTVTNEEVERLEELLDAAFATWAKETDNEPEFYAIEDAELHTVNS